MSMHPDFLNNLNTSSMQPSNASALNLEETLRGISNHVLESP